MEEVFEISSTGFNLYHKYHFQYKQYVITTAETPASIYQCDVTNIKPKFQWTLIGKIPPTGCYKSVFDCSLGIIYMFGEDNDGIIQCLRFNVNSKKWLSQYKIKHNKIDFNWKPESHLHSLCYIPPPINEIHIIDENESHVVFAIDSKQFRIIKREYFNQWKTIQLIYVKPLQQLFKFHSVGIFYHNIQKK
eukprot:356096_1